MENNIQAIEEINAQLEEMARSELALAKLRKENEQRELEERNSYYRDLGIYETSVNQVIRSFELIDSKYLEEAIRNHNINGIVTELLYKPEGLVGVKLHFASRDVDSSNIGIFDKLGQSIRYFFDLGIPLLCDAPIEFKNIILQLTKTNTNDTIPAHIEGPDYIFVYTADTLEQRIKFKKLKISVDRIIANNSGVTFKDKVIATDEKSLEDINVITNYIAVTGTKPTSLTQWKTIDNTYVTIDNTEDWKNLIVTIAEKFQSNFEIAQNKKSLLLNITTQEQLDSI